MYLSIKFVFNYEYNQNNFDIKLLVSIYNIMLEKKIKKKM